MNPTHYKPRLSWWPIVPVRWRSRSHAYGDNARLSWRLYLFGLFPIARVPRRAK